MQHLDDDIDLALDDPQDTPQPHAKAPEPLSTSLFVAAVAGVVCTGSAAYAGHATALLSVGSATAATLVAAVIERRREHAQSPSEGEPMSVVAVEALIAPGGVGGPAPRMAIAAAPYSR